MPEQRNESPAASICPECGHGDGEHEFLCERGVEEIRERAYGSAAYPSPPGPLFTKLCTIESVREAKADPKSASPLLVGCLADALDQAWRDYSRLLRERDLVYGELNKALGGNAPKAWDRIKEAMRRV